MAGSREAFRYVGATGVAALIATLTTLALGRPAQLHAQAQVSARPAPTEGRSTRPQPPALSFDRPSRTVDRRPLAVASCEGETIVGRPLVLRSEGSSPTGQVRWVQIQGPPVELDDPTARTCRATAPAEPCTLGFLLMVADDEGTDSARVTIPIEPRSDGIVLASHRPGQELRADAGDDQIGMVGRQITLNGSRSEPKSRINFRWIQVGGPKVRLDLDDGAIYSFVPQAPGIYQFALVVGDAAAISGPDLVTVSVGRPATPYGVEAAPSPPEALHDVARASLATVPGGLEVAEPLAEAFDGIADRTDLYRCYSEAFSELGRRLEALVPADLARRAVWDERLFVPLTARLIDGMRPEGLDLRVASSQSAELTAEQRAKLAELFRAMARGFRSTRPASPTLR